MSKRLFDLYWMGDAGEWIYQFGGPYSAEQLKAPPMCLYRDSDEEIPDEGQTSRNPEKGAWRWCLTESKPGYHLRTIPKGVLGESTKILEEVMELQDAEKQGVKVMQLAELSDIVGAVKHYLMRHFKDVHLVDLEKMADVTWRAFENGRRK